MPIVRLIGLLVVLLCLVLAPGAARSADYRGVPLKTAAEVASGVGVVQKFDCRGRAIRFGSVPVSGSGFLIGSRLVMTAEHVVAGTSVGTRRVCSHRIWLDGLWYPITRVKAWRQVGKPDRRGIDIATFEIDRPAPGHIFGIADRTPRVGDTVAALGYPFGLPISVAQGVVRKTFRDYGIPTIAARIVTESGNSGGPIVNREGDVVGILQGIYPVVDPNRDGPNQHGGIDLVRWWGEAATADLCRAYPDAGIPDCPDNAGSSFKRVPVELRPRR